MRNQPGPHGFVPTCIRYTRAKVSDSELTVIADCGRELTREAIAETSPYKCSRPCAYGGDQADDERTWISVYRMIPPEPQQLQETDIPTGWGWGGCLAYVTDHAT